MSSGEVATNGETHNGGNVSPEVPSVSLPSILSASWAREDDSTNAISTNDASKVGNNVTLEKISLKSDDQAGDLRSAIVSQTNGGSEHSKEYDAMVKASKKAKRTSNDGRKADGKLG